MRALATALLLTIAGSTAAAQQPNQVDRTMVRYRLGALLLSPLNGDLTGSYSSVRSSLSTGEGFGAGLAIEFVRPRYAFDLEAAWLSFPYTEDLVVPPHDELRQKSGDERFFLYTGAVLLHRTFSSGHDLLAGFMLGTTGDQQQWGLFEDGLVYGLKASLALPSKGHHPALLGGLQLLSVPLSRAYDEEPLFLLLLQLGLRFQ